MNVFALFSFPPNFTAEHNISLYVISLWCIGVSCPGSVPPTTCSLPAYWLWVQRLVWRCSLDPVQALLRHRQNWLTTNTKHNKLPRGKLTPSQKDAVWNTSSHHGQKCQYTQLMFHDQQKWYYWQEINSAAEKSLTWWWKQPWILMETEPKYLTFFLPQKQIYFLEIVLIVHLAEESCHPWAQGA